MLNDSKCIPGSGFLSSGVVQNGDVIDELLAIVLSFVDVLLSMDDVMGLLVDIISENGLQRYM